MKSNDAHVGHANRTGHDRSHDVCEANRKAELGARGLGPEQNGFVKHHPTSSHNHQLRTFFDTQHPTLYAIKPHTELRSSQYRHTHTIHNVPENSGDRACASFEAHHQRRTTECLEPVEQSGAGSIERTDEEELPREG